MCQCFSIQEVSNFIQNAIRLGNLVFHIDYVHAHNLYECKFHECKFHECKFHFNLLFLITP